MSDLDQQIREYIDATSEPVTVGDVRRHVDMVRLPKVSTTSRRSVVALVGSAGLLVAGLVAVLALSASDGTDPAPVSPVPASQIPVTTTQPATSTPSPTTSTAPSGAANLGLGNLVWDQLVGDGGIATVERDHGGYVISGLFDDHLLYSVDGREWTDEPLSPELAGYKAFYSDGEWALGGQQGRWLARREPDDLLRSDGTEWVRVDLEAIGPDVTDSPASSPELPLVWGDTILVPDSNDDNGYWLSTDTTTFEYRRAPWVWPGNVVEPWPDSTIVELPDGGFAAILIMYGVHPDEEALPDNSRDNVTLRFAEVWTSNNGIDWVNQGTPPFLTQWIDAELPYESGANGTNVQLPHRNSQHITVTVGLNSGASPMSTFVTTNGVDWAPVDPDMGLPGRTVADRPSTDERTIVQETDFGYADFEGHVGEGPTRFWISIDGRTWEEVDPPPAFDVELGWGGSSIGATGELIWESPGGGGISIAHFE